MSSFVPVAPPSPAETMNSMCGTMNEKARRSKLRPVATTVLNPLISSELIFACSRFPLPSSEATKFAAIAGAAAKVVVKMFMIAPVRARTARPETPSPRLVDPTG